MNDPTPLHDPPHLTDLTGLLRRDGAPKRFMDYGQAEAATERLAALLLDRLSVPAIAESWFQPIPRGGLIVLGMLSYLLDLKHDQLPPAPRDGRPVVLVDDIALTGARVIEALDALDGAGVVVAHLASHPDLRSAVEEDARVAACVAAIDLPGWSDHAPPDQTERLETAWRKRMQGDRLWIGGPSSIAFSWSEPDRMVWNEHTDTIEPGWRVISPERCLENRRLLGPPSLDRAGRQLVFPDALAVRRESKHVSVCLLNTETVIGLDQVAADMWGALGTLGNVTEAVRHLSTVYSTPQKALGEDLTSFAEHLLATGLLVRANSMGT